MHSQSVQSVEPVCRVQGIDQCVGIRVTTDTVSDIDPSATVKVLPFMTLPVGCVCSTSFDCL